LLRKGADYRLSTTHDLGIDSLLRFPKQRQKFLPLRITQVIGRANGREVESLLMKPVTMVGKAFPDEGSHLLIQKRGLAILGIESQRIITIDVAVDDGHHPIEPDFRGILLRPLLPSNPRSLSNNQFPPKAAAFALGEDLSQVGESPERIPFQGILQIP
jgi:hypothetical protein